MQFVFNDGSVSQQVGMSGNLGTASSSFTLGYSEQVVSLSLYTSQVEVAPGGLQSHLA